jgi:cytosine/adenosine deaminase-related metal-dependent hydrolase
VIAAIGPDLGTTGHTLSAKGCVITPGLVNTHHHLYQTLTRAVPGGQDALLFGWLQTLYPIWSRFTPEAFFISAQVGLAELALSGCTLTSDHLYLYPNGARLEDTIHAAAEIGLRFHPTRGAMSIGESDGGLPPDRLVEREADILNDCIRVVDAFHDPSDGAMVRVGIAPCSPFSVSRELMRDAALLARDKGVMLHTHLAENDEDISYSLATFGMRPGQYAEELGWTGPDVWHAHCVKLDSTEISLFARTRTGVAHCPCSNCRLGSGIAPLRQMRDSGVPVGLGVDGSASNDMGNLILEARQAMLLQRVALGANAMSAREALEIATRGGADVLGRPDCGRLAVGKRADIALWDITGVDSAGSWDPAALVLAGPTRVRDLFVEGRQVVRDGQIATLDLPRVIERQNAIARSLAG